MFAYENLLVYQKAKSCHGRIYQLLKCNQQIPNYFRNQFGRAGLSIALNIAEGSGKFSPKDRRNFFVIARGSTFECAAILDLLFAEKEISVETKTDLQTQLEEISKMLYAMIKQLEVVK